ncbi:MAG: hypothetical protein AABO57_19075 [Acidobacteriota bacterium]
MRDRPDTIIVAARVAITHHASRFTHHASRITFHASRIILSSLIGYDQPGAAVASVDSKFGDESQLAAGRAAKRIHVLALSFAPEMVFYQNFHPDLSLRHCPIINDRQPAGTRKGLEPPPKLLVVS